MSDPGAVAGKGLWPDSDAAADAVERPPGAPGSLRRAFTRVLAARLMASLHGIVRPGASAGVAPARRLARLSRKTRSRALRRMRQLPCFRAADYLERHRDVAAAGMDPALHALFVGSFEDRVVVRPETLARCLPTIAPGPPAASAMPASPPRIGIYVSSFGNVFMRDIAEDLAASLRTACRTVVVLDETAPIRDRPELCVFVAPHEFFLLGQGPAWVRDDVIAAAVMLNTEQPQAPWFARALPFLLAARGVVDLCAQTAGLLAQAGVPSLHLTPAPDPDAHRLTDADRRHPLFRVLPAAARSAASPRTPLAARPLDIAFFASDSPHRDGWLARNAGFLAEHECFLYYRRLARGPLCPDGADGGLTRIARHVCCQARIALNLHRDAFGFLEWHRVVRLGLASGALVVSEPSLPHPLLRAGEHFIEESAQLLPNLLEWLLRSEDGRRRAETIRENAAALLAGRLTPRDTAATFLRFLEHGAA